MELHVHRRSSDAYCQVSLGQLDLVPSEAPKNCAYRATVPQQLWTSQFGSNGKANPTVRNGLSSKCPPPANRASVSNRSYPNRSPTPEATSPKECRCEERTGCLSGRLDQVAAAVRLSGSVSVAIKEDQSSPTNRQGVWQYA